MMAGEFDISGIPVEGETQGKDYSNIDMSKSVLSPEYRSRDPFGPQQIGGVIGGVAGSLLGPVGSTIGAGAGGALGEAVEQYQKDEPFSLSRIGMSGLEEAAWDAGGNLVLKGLGKTLRFASDKLGFTKSEIPDANKAAQTFLEKQGSSLPLAARTGSNLDSVLEGLVHTPATSDIFKRKQQEIQDALRLGQKDVIKQFTGSPEFEQALRSGSSAQRASGEVLKSFIKQGEEALGEAVAPTYQKIFSAAPKTNLIETTTGGMPKVSTFSLNSWASGQLVNPMALTKGQESILKEIKNLPSTVDFDVLHKIRSRWLAENRDKYASNGTEKDSLASKTITSLVKKIDEAMDFSAKNTLPEDLLKEYRQVTKTYREGIQALQTDSIQKAMEKNPEEVGSFLFASGNETPIQQLYKSVAAAGTISGKSSKEILDSLRIGYLDAMTHTPENMLKFAKEIEQNKNVQNTFNVLFGGTPQKQAIEAMNEAAKKGLVEARREPGFNLKTAGVLAGTASTAAALGTGYVFFLNPQDQDKFIDALGASAVAGGGLILSQRQLAKVMLDPKGAKAITLLSQARDKAYSPTVFTKLVVEPIYNSLNKPAEDSIPLNKSLFDISNIPVRQ